MINWEKVVTDGIIYNDQQKSLCIDTSIFKKLAEQSFTENRFYFRHEHLSNWQKIIDDEKSSIEEKKKMTINLQAAILAGEKKIPYCQDCGTDTVFIFQGSQTFFQGNLAENLEQGALSARQKNPFRNSIFVPEEDFSEKNSGNNSPTEIRLFPVKILKK